MKNTVIEMKEKTQHPLGETILKMKQHDRKERINELHDYMTILKNSQRIHHKEQNKFLRDKETHQRNIDD